MSSPRIPSQSVSWSGGAGGSACLRAILPGALVALAVVMTPYFLFSQTSTTTTTTTAKPATKAAPKPKKKRTVRPRATAEKTVQRPVSRPPLVSVALRTQANEDVNGILERTADMPLENPAAMVPFFEQLRRSKSGESSGPLSILHYGDSHTAADEWTGSVRLLLQAQFGDGGGGYSLAGRPFLGYRRLDLKSGESRGWHSDGLLARGGDGMYGLGGVSISTTLRGQSITLDAECHRLELFFLRQPGGGVLQLSDNGVAVDQIGTGGELGPGYFQYEVTQSIGGQHHFELMTLQHAPVRLFGWVTEKDRGVTYEAMGINGAQASILFRWDETILASHIARRNPALIVLAYGTNEAHSSDWTQESYRDMFSALLQRLRRDAPTASILVLGPPDHEYSRQGPLGDSRKAGPHRGRAARGGALESLRVLGHAREDGRPGRNARVGHRRPRAGRSRPLHHARVPAPGLHPLPRSHVQLRKVHQGAGTSSPEPVPTRQANEQASADR